MSTIQDHSQILGEAWIPDRRALLYKYPTPCIDGSRFKRKFTASFIPYTSVDLIRRAPSNLFRGSLIHLLLLIYSALLPHFCNPFYCSHSVAINDSWTKERRVMTEKQQKRRGMISIFRNIINCHLRNVF